MFTSGRGVGSQKMSTFVNIYKVENVNRGGQKSKNLVNRGGQKSKNLVNVIYEKLLFQSG
jgi:hypothetical protein